LKIITVTLNPCIDRLCTVSHFTPGGLNRVCLVRSDIAGKGINVAIALKNLGLSPICMGINFAQNGAELTQKLDLLGVQHDFITAEGAIRENLKLREESTGIMTEINQPGAFVSEEIQARLIKKIADAGANSDGILVLSGSRPQGIAADFYARLCNAWRGKIFVDTEGEALKLALSTGKVFAIKPNLFELETAFGVKLSGADEIAAFCREKLLAPSRNENLEIVCVSMGAEGAVLATRSGSFFCPALPVQAKGLAGAGDAMVAGCARRTAITGGASANVGVLSKPDGLSGMEILSDAMAAAAASVILEGTQMCTAQGFRKMLEIMPEIREI